VFSPTAVTIACPEPATQRDLARRTPLNS
jgi:hypothetical protein